MRSVLFVVGVLGIALSTRVSSGQPAGPDLATVSAEMTIVVQPQRVEITGAVSSAANEEMLRETAARVFPARTTVADLQQRIGLPPGWALVTDLTLQSLAETRSATATISPYQVTVRGFSEEGGGWRSAADRSRAYLPEGWVMNHQVEEIISGGSMNRLSGVANPDHRAHGRLGIRNRQPVAEPATCGRRRRLPGSGWHRDTEDQIGGSRFRSAARRREHGTGTQAQSTYRDRAAISLVGRFFGGFDALDPQ
jgi:hypothetical protein